MGILRSGQRASLPTKEEMAAKEHLSMLRNSTDSLENYFYGITKDLSGKATSFYKQVANSEIEKVTYDFLLSEHHITEANLERDGKKLEDIKPRPFEIKSEGLAPRYKFNSLSFEKRTTYRNPELAVAREDFAEMKLGNDCIHRVIIRMISPIESETETAILTSKIQLLQDFLNYMVTAGMSVVEADLEKKYKYAAMKDVKEIDKKIKEVDDIFSEVLKTEKHDNS